MEAFFIIKRKMLRHVGKHNNDQVKPKKIKIKKKLKRKEKVVDHDEI